MMKNGAGKTQGDGIKMGGGIHDGTAWWEKPYEEEGEVEEKRMIFIECLKPFISESSHQRIKVNVDIIEQKLSKSGYFRERVKNQQLEIDRLRDEVQSMRNYENFHAEAVLKENTRLREELNELQESDSWQESHRDMMENGGCPECYAGDEGIFTHGHKEGCEFGKLEQRVVKLEEILAEVKCVLACESSVHDRMEAVSLINEAPRGDSDV